MINYFELYNLPVTFHPDPTAVRSRYYELSRKYHPDRFANAEAAERTEALRMAALNNDAYKTLGDTDAVMAYILKLNGLLEKNEKYALPPDFLMEMMDLNEAVSDYEMQPDDEQAMQQATTLIDTLLADWDEAAGDLTDRYNNGEQTQELLLQIKDFYYRKKYLLRIQERIDKFAR